MKKITLLILLGIFCIGAFSFVSIKPHKKITHVDSASIKQSIATESAAPARSPSQNTITLPIITYHYVEVVKDPKDTLRKKLAVTPQTLEEQLLSLRDSEYSTIWVKEIPEMLNCGKTRNKKVSLTFDDGYEDFYINVFPLLKKYNMKATLYMISGWIDTKGYLSLQQLNEIRDSKLVEIGAHTLNHPKLTELDAFNQEWQITQSKLLLEEKLGIKVATFAYPYGAYNRSLTTMVKEAGYTTAVTTDSGFTQSNTNLYSLKRIRAGTFYGKHLGKELDTYYKQTN